MIGRRLGAPVGRIGRGGLRRRHGFAAAGEVALGDPVDALAVAADAGIRCRARPGIGDVDDLVVRQRVAGCRSDGVAVLQVVRACAPK